jgi:hypothetical protein
MTSEEFRNSLGQSEPPGDLSAPLAALWWDAHGDSTPTSGLAGDPGGWARAHGLVDELETREGMAVHAYLHRKEGSEWNANYWYDRAGRTHRRENLQDEWEALVKALLKESSPTA